MADALHLGGYSQIKASASAYYRSTGTDGNRTGYEPCAVVGTRGSAYPCSTNIAHALLAEKKCLLVHVPRETEARASSWGTAVAVSIVLEPFLCILGPWHPWSR